MKICKAPDSLSTVLENTAHYEGHWESHNDVSQTPNRIKMFSKGKVNFGFEALGKTKLVSAKSDNLCSTIRDFFIVRIVFLDSEF